MQTQCTPLFTGCATAMVTPFLPGGAVDEDALRRLLRFQIQSGIDAIVLLGTTGEPCTIDMRERERIITLGLEESNGRIPVIVGTGSNDTRKAITYAKQANQLGAQGQLCVTPYYNKATQTGLLRHFGAILDSCALPMILYNVPGRTGMGISSDTVAVLAQRHGIVGLKEASGDPSLTVEIIEKTSGNLPIYCGNDDIITALMAIGACGAISVCSNVVPAQTKAITHACLSGCFDEARSAQLTLTPLIRALFSQVNPIPIKAALSMMGMLHDELRLPLTPMDEPHRSNLQTILRHMQFIP